MKLFKQLTLANDAECSKPQTECAGLVCGECKIYVGNILSAPFGPPVDAVAALQHSYVPCDLYSFTRTGLYLDIAVPDIYAFAQL